MPTIDIKGTLVDFPDDLTPEQLTDRVRKTASQLMGSPEKTSLAGKAWDALAVPEKLSKEGLQMIASAVSPKQETTGNMARDIAVNTPKIAMETLSEVAPAFVSRGSIITVGALGGLKGAGKVVGKILPKIATPLEAGSGLQKGTLVEAYKDPKMIIDFGRKAKAQEIYNEVKQGASVPKNLMEAKNTRIVDKAVKAMSEGNILPAPDAFNARKAVRSLIRANQKSKVFNDDFLIQTEKGLTEMVFSGANKADKLYQSAIRGEQMRNLSRLNKNGTTGPVSAAIMAKIPGLAPFMSPLTQGAGASLAGAASKISTSVAARPAGLVGLSKVINEEKIREYLRKYGNDKSKAREAIKKDGYEIPE